MAGISAIEWTERTWNPIKGCKVLSPGCTNCYAMRLAGTRLKAHPSYAGLTIDTRAGPVWTGEMRLDEKALLEPLGWRTPRVIFVNSMSDLFAEGVPDEWIDRIYAVMALTPQHTYQVLTKRAARMRTYFAGIPELPNEPALRGALIEGEAQALWSARNGGADPSLWLAVHTPLPNVWHGVSAEDQARAAERIPDLLRTPSAIRFVSVEPLIGAIELSRIQTLQFRGAEVLNGLTGRLAGMFGDPCATRLPALDWVIVGGESGDGARPMLASWARQVRDECTAAGVPFFFKQWGEFLPDDPASDARTAMVRIGKKAAGRRLDGRLHDDRPEIRA